MLLVELRAQGVKLDGVVVEQPKPRNDSRAERAALALLRFANPRKRSGSFKALSPWHWFFWRKLSGLLLFLRSPRRREIEAPYRAAGFDALLAGSRLLRTRDVNSAETYVWLRERGYDVGVLGGVGVVSAPILGAFRELCLNAHPAPLPHARGGGALEQTLFHGLAPTVSVHVATTEIDGGDILAQQPVPVLKHDDFWLLRWRCDVVAARAMAGVVRVIQEGRPPGRRANTGGKLNYWRDCTLDVQRGAERRLRELQRGL